MPIFIPPAPSLPCSSSPRRAQEPASGSADIGDKKSVISFWGQNTSCQAWQQALNLLALHDSPYTFLYIKRHLERFLARSGPKFSTVHSCKQPWPRQMGKSLGLREKYPPDKGKHLNLEQKDLSFCPSSVPNLLWHLCKSIPSLSQISQLK